MFVMARALAARERLRDAFQGEYVPLRTVGARADSLFAFARRHGSEYAITCVPRLLAPIVADHDTPPLGDTWLDTCVELPPDIPSSLRNVFTGVTVTPQPAAAGTTIAAAILFADLPVALLAAP
jgi:(1->4)-alpha-D-glucan 1-alpha-D-glucosylmutase